MSASAADFRQWVESVNVAEASTEELFGSGRTLRGMVARYDSDPALRREVAEAVSFFQRQRDFGRVGIRRIAEAMTRDDFPLLFGTGLSRELLSGYEEVEYTWSNYAAERTVSDFRDHDMHTVGGGDGRLEKVGERAPYPETSFEEGEHSLSVVKYGRRIDFSFEMLINDDLNAFGDQSVVRAFGRGARRTEEHLATQQFVDANGPHASLYTSGNNNIVTSNPALTRSALQAALTQLMEQTDESGEPISINAVELVVPTALALTAKEIINAREYRVVEGGNTRIISGNGVDADLRVNVNHYISTVASTANGDTSWFLFANPSSSRPAIAVGNLRGYETPQIFAKASNSSQIGGAEDFVDFETDSRPYKVRHVIGATRVDPKATVASNGSGS